MEYIAKPKLTIPEIIELKRFYERNKEDLNYLANSQGLDILDPIEFELCKAQLDQEREYFSNNEFYMICIANQCGLNIKSIRELIITRKVYLQSIMYN